MSANNITFRLWLNGELIGTVTNVDADMPSIIGTLHPADAFEKYRHLFEKEYSALKDNNFSELERAMNEIFALGLVLEDTEAGMKRTGAVGKIIDNGIGWLHIDGMKIWWRPT